MNADKILLTHFSARYPKMPPQIVDQNLIKPLTALFRSSPLSSPSNPPISALPDAPMESTSPTPSPPSKTTPKPKQKETKNKQPIVGLAFDHMNIKLGEFWKLRIYLPAMDQAFGKDGEDEENSERDLEDLN